MKTWIIRLDGCVSRGGGLLYLATPEALPPSRFVLAVHGSGREALSYRDIPFYRSQRDIALGCGLGFAALSMGQDTWGRPQGLADLAKAADCLASLSGSGRLGLWASSAGGSLMFRFAQVYGERVGLMLGTFPVWDLEACAQMDSCARAWGKPPWEELRRALAPYNPARYPAPMQPCVICHGREDAAVPPAKHVEALARLRPLDVYYTQDGHSTQAFGLYRTPLLEEALKRLGKEGG